MLTKEKKYIDFLCLADMFKMKTILQCSEKCQKGCSTALLQIFQTNISWALPPISLWKSFHSEIHSCSCFLTLLYPIMVQ